MQCLLDMRLTDSTRVFALGMNARRQTPLHIAAQSAQNQPETIRLLQQAMPGKWASGFRLSLEFQLNKTVD
jgi:hypothetical protein